jgi:hypothetical protein
MKILQSIRVSLMTELFSFLRPYMLKICCNKGIEKGKMRNLDDRYLDCQDM